MRQTWSPVPAFDGGSREYVAGPAKSDAGQRTIPIPEWLCEDLAADLALRRPVQRQDPLILNKQGRAVNRDTFRAKVVRPALQAAGLPEDFRTGMAERVAAQVSEELAQLSETEAWEVELEVEPTGTVPSEESLREELVEAVRDGTHMLDAEIDVHLEKGKLVLLAVLVLAVVGMTGASKRFSQVGKSADVLRLRLEDYGSIIEQTIRRAA